MISKASSYLTSLLLKERIIEAEDQEIYEYGFEITLANLVNGTIVLLIGNGFHRLPDAVLFYLVFVSLRFFCGGYHANSYLGCFCSFSLTTALCLMISGWLTRYTKAVAGLYFVAVIALWLCIFKIAPIEHENRPLTQEERSLFRKRSMQVGGFWTVVGIILWMAHWISMAASLISAFIAVTILMTGGKNMKKEILKLLAKVAGDAAKRADGRASEFGMHQPKKPAKK